MKFQSNRKTKSSHPHLHPRHSLELLLPLSAEDAAHLPSAGRRLSVGVAAAACARRAGGPAQFPRRYRGRAAPHRSALRSGGGRSAALRVRGGVVVVARDALIQGYVRGRQPGGGERRGALRGRGSAQPGGRSVGAAQPLARTTVLGVWNVGRRLAVWAVGMVAEVGLIPA